MNPSQADASFFLDAFQLIEHQMLSGAGSRQAMLEAAQDIRTEPEESALVEDIIECLAELPLAYQDMHARIMRGLEGDVPDLEHIAEFEEQGWQLAREGRRQAIAAGLPEAAVREVLPIADEAWHRLAAPRAAELGEIEARIPELWVEISPSARRAVARALQIAVEAQFDEIKRELLNRKAP